MNERVPIHALTEDGIPRFFAAANTSSGFTNGFDDLLGHYAPKRLFILKGGPGVGKSTLMKRAASFARERGAEVHLYHCSSDETSLDGVFIPSLGIGILDGTPPHTVEPPVPGCGAETVDLSAAWDTEKLRDERDTLTSLSESKRRAYRAAYASLSAAGALTREADARLAECVDHDKMNAAACRLVSKLGTVKGKGGANLPSKLFAEAFGTRGAVRSFAIERMAKTRLLVTSVHGTEALFFEAFAAHAEKKGCRVCRFADPLIPAKTAGVYLPDASLCVTSFDAHIASSRRMDDNTHTVNMSRFFDAAVYRTHRTLCRFCEKTAAELIENALMSLKEAGNAHAAMEEIYGAATDYDIVRSIGEKRVLTAIEDAF